ncbi:unnamed protein product [Closterium sp. NIES-53]
MEGDVPAVMGSAEELAQLRAANAELRGRAGALHGELRAVNHLAVAVAAELDAWKCDSVPRGEAEELLRQAEMWRALAETAVGKQSHSDGECVREAAEETIEEAEATRIAEVHMCGEGGKRARTDAEVARETVARLAREKAEAERRGEEEAERRRAAEEEMGRLRAALEEAEQRAEHWRAQAERWQWEVARLRGDEAEGVRGQARGDGVAWREEEGGRREVAGVVEGAGGSGFGDVGGEEDTGEAERETLGQWQAQVTRAGLLGVAGREDGASAVLHGGLGENEGTTRCDTVEAGHAGVGAGQARVCGNEEGVRAGEVERGADAAQERRMGAAERVVGCDAEGEEWDGREEEEDSCFGGQSGGARGEQQCKQGGYECAEEWWQYGEGEGRAGVDEKVAKGGMQEAGRCVVETAGRDGVVEAMEDDACMRWGGQGMRAALVREQEEEEDAHTREERGGERSRGAETEWEGGLWARTEEEGMLAGVGRGEAVSAKVEEWERRIEEAHRGGVEVWQAGLGMARLCPDAHGTLAQDAGSMGVVGRGALVVDRGGAGVWVESGVGGGGAVADGCGDEGCVAVHSGGGARMGQGSMGGVTQGQDEKVLRAEQGRREGMAGLDGHATGDGKVEAEEKEVRVMEVAGLVVMCEEDSMRLVTDVKVEKDEIEARGEKGEEQGIEARDHWCKEAGKTSEGEERANVPVAAEVDKSAMRSVSVEGLREECEEEAVVREVMRCMEVVVVRDEMARPMSAADRWSVQTEGERVEAASEREREREEMVKRRGEGGEILMEEGRGAMVAECGRLQAERDRARAEEEREEARRERDCCVKAMEDVARARDEAERRVEQLQKLLSMGSRTENEVQGEGQVTVGESVGGGEKRGIGEDMAWSEMMQERGVEEMERRCRAAEEERDAAKRRKEEVEEELAVAVRERDEAVARCSEMEQERSSMEWALREAERAMEEAERAVDEAEEERMQAERAREDADRQRDEAERGREEEERKRKEDARKRAEAERGRQEAERRREEAERRREEAERRRDEAENRIEEAERKKEEADWVKEEAERRSDEAEKRSEEAERRREEAEREKEEAEWEKQEVEKEREEEERKREDAGKRREEAEKRRQEAERRREEAERRREEAERRRDEAESRIGEAERKKEEAEWEKEEAERKSEEAERRREAAKREKEEAERRKDEAERSRDEAERRREAAERELENAERGRDLGEKERVDAERDNVCSRREKAAHGMRVEEEVACAREVDGVGVAGLGEEVACSDVRARAHAGRATARPAALHAREGNSALGAVLAGICALGGSSNGHDTSNSTTSAVMGGGPAWHTTATPCATDTANASTASSATAASTCSRSAHTSHVPHNWHGSCAHGSHASHASHTSLSSHASHAPAPGSCHSSPPFVPAHAAELTTTCSCAADTPIGPLATVAAEAVQPETSSEAPAVTASTHSHSSSCPPTGGGPPHTMLAALAPTAELLLSRQHLRSSPPAVAAATDVVAQIRAGEVSWSRQVREVQGQVQRAAVAWACVERRAGLVEETARQLLAEVERAEEKRRLAEEGMRRADEERRRTEDERRSAEEDRRVVESRLREELGKAQEELVRVKEAARRRQVEVEQAMEAKRQRVRALTRSLLASEEQMKKLVALLRAAESFGGLDVPSWAHQPYVLPQELLPSRCCPALPCPALSRCPAQRCRAALPSAVALPCPALPRRALPCCRAYCAAAHTALLAARCPACRALPCSPLVTCAMHARSLRPARTRAAYARPARMRAAYERPAPARAAYARPALLPTPRCPAVRAPPCPTARALPCPAARTLPCPAARAPPCPAARALHCPAARTPCSPRAALPVARFEQDLPVLRLHSDRGGEFSSGLLQDYCRAGGIAQSFTLPASPQKNVIGERRIGLIMELNLWPHVSVPETSPTLCWTGEVGDASAFRVWGTLSLVHDTTAGKLSPRTLRCVFLGFPTDAPPWQFYHPASRRVLSSQDVTFDESVCFHRLHPHMSSPLSSWSQVDQPPLVEPLEVSSDTSGPAEGGDPAAGDTAATRRSPRLGTPPGFPPRPSSPPPQPVAVDSGAAGGGDPEVADSGGAGPRVAESEGASSGVAESGGAGSGGLWGCRFWGTTQALYDPVVARYSSPATAALGRLLLPYLFPELSAFATVEDLVSHLRASEARYRAAVSAEFLDKNQPPMFITLYFIVTRLPDSLRSVTDHFLSLDPTSLNNDLLEQHVLAAETSAVAVGAACGTPRPPFFEGCSPSPHAPSYAFAPAADVSVAEDVGAASTSAKCHSGKGKGGGGGSGSGGGGSGSSGGGSSGGGGGGGTGGGSGGSGGGGGGSGGSGGSGSSGTGGGGTGARRVGSGGGQLQQQHRRSETQSPQQLREWFLRRAYGGSCPYVIRTGDRADQTCGRLHTQHRCFSRLDDAWRAEFGDDVKLPRWADLLRFRIAIFDLDFDAILSAIYALSVSAERDCYWCVLPDPGIAAAALGASESGSLPGTTPAQALHTFTLDSGASACFFRDSTTLNPLSTPVSVRLADPSGGPILAHSSTVLLWSSLYTLTTEPPLVAASAQVSASGQVAASCSCRLLSHQTLLWHRRLGHPSLPRLRGIHSRLLVSGLPRSLPPLPPSPAPHCLPCVEGRQRAAPHSSSFPLTTAPLQTLHMDVKGEVVDVLIPWIRTIRLQLREQFGHDLPVLRLHSDRVGEFSSNLLQDICRGEGILQLFTLPDSPQQNGIAERRIGLVIEVARTSMIHAAAPHFLWPFAVRYAAHQLNLWPRVSLPETSLTLRWTGEVGDASVFRFYHPTLRRVFPSHDVTFDESVPFYRLFPYRSAPPPPPPLFLAPGPPPVDPLLPQGPAPSSVSQVDPLPGPAPVQVAVGSGAAQGTASGGAEPGGAESEGAEIGGAELEGVETWGAEPGGAASKGAEFGGAEPQVAASSGGSADFAPRLSPQQQSEWLVWRAHPRSGATGARGAGAAGVGGAGVATGAGVTGGTAATGPEGARTQGTGAAGTGGVEGAGAGDPTESRNTGAGGSGASGAGAGGAVVGGVGAGDAGVGVLGGGGTGAGGAGTVDPVAAAVTPGLSTAFPSPSPSPYTEQSGGLTERRERASRPVSPVCTAHRVPRSRPPAVPGTHVMTLCPSSVPLRVPLPAPPESSLPEVPHPESDRARAASPFISCLLATAVNDPSFESDAASALVAELLDFAAACRLDYATALVAEFASANPPSVGGECALGTDVLEDRQEDFECLAAAVPCFASMLLAPEGDPDAPDIPTPRSYAEAITSPYSSQWQAAMDAEMASWKSTCTYVDEVPPPGANIVNGMWIFRVKRPPGSQPAFKARYVARGTQWSLQRPVYGLRQAPRKWHDTLRTTLAALGFAPVTADPSLFLRTDTSLSPLYVLVYVDDLVLATADTEALTLVKSELQKRHTCTDLGELHSYLGLQITRDRARRTITLTQSHMGHQLVLGSPLPAPSPFPERTGSLTERRVPGSRPTFPVRTVSHARHLRPPPVPDTHIMTLHPSSVPLRVALPSPPASSLPNGPDPYAASALVTELVDFAATRRLDYVTSLVSESESVCPPSVRGDLALSSDVLEDRQFELECLVAALPHFASMLLCPEGDPNALDIHTPRSYAEAITGTYVDVVPPPGANIVDDILKRQIYGLHQAPREWHDTQRAMLAALWFAPSTAKPSLFLRTNPALPFYILVYVDDLVFATAYTEAFTLVKAELQKRHTCTDLGELHNHFGFQICENNVRIVCFSSLQWGTQ